MVMTALGEYVGVDKETARRSLGPASDARLRTLFFEFSGRIRITDERAVVATD